ncbi:hypothetical protein BDY19DRAFT_991313 [Irpex rosettiformis]|uniref:Uncharacterized protein n=1 Tax=Irpex rosettiformis TaxID=378272 RepID=A0ACB8UBI9_9APHY|nr:hypothetical protein BDY19DRAFT_991313 [Irpex rosettiformis]
MQLRSQTKRAAELVSTEEEFVDIQPRKKQRKIIERAVFRVKATERALTTRQTPIQRRILRSAAPSASPPKVPHPANPVTPPRLEPIRVSRAATSPTTFAQPRHVQIQRPVAPLPRRITRSRAAAMLQEIPDVEMVDSNPPFSNPPLKQKKRDLKGKGRAVEETYDTFDTFEARVAALKTANKEKDATIEELQATLARLDEEIKAASFVSQGQQAAEIVKKLEDMHSCALCYEVLASPYVINSPQCGHSYCALCLLKWFFTHLHTDCGTWHDNLQCPLCRTPLPETSEIAQTLPRKTATCPFTPDRHADKVIATLVQSLSETLNPRGTSKEDLSEEAEVLNLIFEDAEDDFGWGIGGSRLSDWEYRRQLGKKAMNSLISRWGRLSPRDFVRFKRNLGL